MQEELTTIKWRPSMSNGALGEEVEVTMLASDVEAMREWWKEIKALDAMQQTQQLQEFRLMMDAFARFPGTTVVRSIRDPELGAALRDQAEERVDRAADAEVKADALRAIRNAAAERPSITTDDVWERMITKPREPRMLGPIMKKAEKLGLIQYTEKTIQSDLPQNHRRPVRIWRSLLFDAQQNILQ